MNTKDQYNMIKQEIVVLERERQGNRSSKLWTQIKEMKKKKLKLKDKLNAIK